MKQYKTGKIYKEFIQKTEMSVMNFDGKNVDIFILRENPPADVVESVKSTVPFFQIYTKNNIIFILIKFEDLDWIDIPYINQTLTLQEIKDDISGYPCKIHFANSKTGELLVERYTCISNGLSKAFFFAIQEQKSHLPVNVIQKINSIRASFHPNEIARLSLGK